MRWRVIARSLFATALLVSLVATGLADRDTAKFHSKRGESALKSKKHEEAVGHFRRALEEDEDYLPARFGLARGLLGSDQREEGVTELRALVAQLGDAETAKAWRKLKRDAGKLLGAVDRAGAELAKAVDAHANALVSFAKKWRKKDEDTAVRALRIALELRPGHGAASKLIAEMGRSARGPVKSLFNGKSLDGWIDMTPPSWEVQDGAIVGVIQDAGLIGRSAELFEGDFDVSVEMKMIEEFAGPSMFCVAPAFDGRDAHYTFGVLKGRFLFQEDLDEDSERDVANPSPPHSYDEKEWHVFELRFRGTVVRALVDGQEVGVDDERPESRSGGFIGLKVQNCRAAFRNITITPR